MKKTKIISILLFAMALAACGDTSDAANNGSSDYNVINSDSVTVLEENADSDKTGSEENNTSSEEYTVISSDDSESEEASSSAENEEPDSNIIAESGEDSFKVVSFKAEKSGSYSFTHSGEDDTPWNVYILDESFSDGIRYLYSNYDPQGVTDYTAEISEGQYVYCICTVNEWTSDTPADTELTVKYIDENGQSEASSAEEADEEASQSDISDDDFEEVTMGVDNEDEEE